MVNVTVANAVVVNVMVVTVMVVNKCHAWINLVAPLELSGTHRFHCVLHRHLVGSCAASHNHQLDCANNSESTN